MKLLQLCRTLVAAAFAMSAASAQNLEPAAANKPAPKPKDPALIEVADVPGLPRVLLIGDSISMGYTLPVRELLKGWANVHRPLENCGDTARGLAHLDRWLGAGHWDVIHFNFGLHDLKYLDENGKYVAKDQGKQVASPEVYRERLRTLTQRLKATGAKVIFATTTPVPEGTLGRVAGDDKIYNTVALEVMQETGVPIDDLGAYVREQEANPATKIQNPANVHFSAKGYEQLAKLVSASIEKALPAH